MPSRAEAIDQPKPAENILIIETNAEEARVEPPVGGGQGHGNEIQYLVDQWSEKSTNINAVEIDKTSNIDRMYTDKSHLPPCDITENNRMPSLEEKELQSVEAQEHQAEQMAQNQPGQQLGDLRKPKFPNLPPLAT